MSIYQGPTLLSGGGIADRVQAVIEQNKSLDQKFWRGTKEEYNALTSRQGDTMYIITDENTGGTSSGGGGQSPDVPMTIGNGFPALDMNSVPIDTDFGRSYATSITTDTYGLQGTLPGSGTWSIVNYWCGTYARQSAMSSSGDSIYERVKFYANPDNTGEWTNWLQLPSTSYVDTKAAVLGTDIAVNAANIDASQVTTREAVVLVNDTVNSDLKTVLGINTGSSGTDAAYITTVRYNSGNPSENNYIQMARPYCAKSDKIAIRSCQIGMGDAPNPWLLLADMKTVNSLYNNCVTKGTFSQAITGMVKEKDIADMKKAVTATSTSQKTISVEVDKLVDYVKTMPRLLTDEITLQLSGVGTISTRLEIVGFYGPGSLTINGFAAQDAQFTGACRIDRNSVPILITNMNFIGGGTNNNWYHNGVVSVISSPTVTIQDTTIDGGNIAVVSGICVYNNSQAVLSRCTINNAARQAVYCFLGAKTTLTQCSGANNGYGFVVDDGGTIFYGTGTPDGIGATSATYKYGGGLIVSGSGLK